MTTRFSKRLSLSTLFKSKRRSSTVNSVARPLSTPAKYSRDIRGSTSVKYSRETLEDNGIFVLETGEVFTGTMPDVSTICGENVPSSPAIASAVEDLHRNLNNMKRHTSIQIVSLLSHFFEDVAGTQEFDLQVCKSYNFHFQSTAEPHEVKSRHLQSPQPNLSFGYGKADFTSFFDAGLQDNIIEAPDGQLFDLGKVSQPIKGHYWPFFVVEVSEKSMLAARQAASVAAATSNHAVKLLSALIKRPAEKDSGTAKTDPSESFDICFSLTIYGQIATFNIHVPRGPVEYLSVALKTYRLAEWQDLADLATNVRCIMTWARSRRLPALIGKLQALDRSLNIQKPLTIQPECYETNAAIHGTLSLGSTYEGQPGKKTMVNVYPSWAKNDHTGQIQSWI